MNYRSIRIASYYMSVLGALIGISGFSATNILATLGKFEMLGVWGICLCVGSVSMFVGNIVFYALREDAPLVIGKDILFYNMYMLVSSIFIVGGIAINFVFITDVPPVMWRYAAIIAAIFLGGSLVIQALYGRNGGQR